MSTSDETITPAPPAGGQRRLLRRRLPEDVHHLRAAEPAEERAARKAVADARERLELASYRTDTAAEQAITAAQATLDQAQAALAACYEPVVIQALPPSEFEDLAAAHPARDGQDEPYNMDTLGPELFFLGVQGPLSREEWEAEVVPQLARGEWMALKVTALSVNGRLTDGAIPKG